MAYKELSKEMFNLLLPNITGAYAIYPFGDGAVRTINYYVSSYFENTNFKYYILISGIHLKRLNFENGIYPFNLNLFVVNNIVTVVTPATHDFIILCLTNNEKKDYFDKLCNYHTRTYYIYGINNELFKYILAQIDKDLFLFNNYKYVKAKDFDEALDKVKDSFIGDITTLRLVNDIIISDWED